MSTLKNAIQSARTGLEAFEILSKLLNPVKQPTQVFMGNVESGGFINDGKNEVIGNYNLQRIAEQEASKSDSYKVVGYENGFFKRGWLVIDNNAPVFQDWKSEGNSSKSDSRAGRFKAIAVGRTVTVSDTLTNQSVKTTVSEFYEKPAKEYASTASKLAVALLEKSDNENAIEPEGKENQVKTAKGTKINTGFTVIEATKLITSHDETGKPNPEYPQELQPRDRARDTSQQQIAKIANNIDPDLLGRTRVAYQGAPIIGKDRVVESGNGRAIAINLAYKLGKAEEYRDWLLEVADMYGVSVSKIERMKRPVLVRVRTSDVDRVQFAMEANQSDMLAMTATEKAKSDANRLNDSLMSRLSGDGDLNSLANRDFIMDFLKSLGESEAAQYSTTDGMPTKQLYDRVQAALFAKAYNDDRLLEMMAESEKVEIANTIKALNQAAPHFIRARAISHKVTDGVTRQVGDAVELSLDDQAVNALIEATNVLKAAKNSGMSLEEYLKQTNVFGDDVDPVVAQMAIFIKDNNRSSNRMGVAFQTMAEFVADELERRQNESLFVDDPDINLLDVLKAANERLKKQFGDDVKTIGGGTGGFIDIFTETRGQKKDREAFLSSQPHIDMLNAVINGDYDNETSEDLLTRIETAANAIDSTQYDDLISKAMDKWLVVDNKVYLLDSVDFDDTSGIMGWFDNTVSSDRTHGIVGWFDNTGVAYAP